MEGMHEKTWLFARPDLDKRRGDGVEQVCRITDIALSHAPRLKQRKSLTVTKRITLSFAAMFNTAHPASHVRQRRSGDYRSRRVF